MVTKRDVAVWCALQDLVQGEFVTRDAWQPNAVRTVFGEVARTSVMGTVVALQDPSAFVLDDGSASVLVRSFDQVPKHSVTIGDTVLVIGRPRKYQEELFVFPEIVRKLENPTWRLYRQQVLQNRRANVNQVIISNAKEETEQAQSQQVVSTASSIAQKILDTVRSFDKGSGAEVGSVEHALRTPDFDKHLTRMVEEGELFYVRPGMLKVLE